MPEPERPNAPFCTTSTKTYPSYNTMILLTLWQIQRWILVLKTCTQIRRKRGGFWTGRRVRARTSPLAQTASRPDPIGQKTDALRNLRTELKSPDELQARMMYKERVWTGASLLLAGSTGRPARRGPVVNA